MNNEWLPIETAPKDGTPILAKRAFENDGDEIPVVVRWADTYDNGNPAWEVVIYEAFHEYKLTHWMKLPL